MRKLKTLIFFFFTSKQFIYNKEVKSHNKYIKIYSDINIANSLTLINVSFMVQKLKERRKIISCQYSYKIKI